MDPVTVANFIDSLQHGFLADDDDAETKRREAENIRLLQEQYRAIARSDFPAFVNHLSEDVELEILGPVELPFVGHWQGRAPVVEALMRNFSFFENQRPQLESVVAQGNYIVVTAREQGHYRPIQHDYELHWVQVFFYRDGKLQRVRELTDGGSLIDALRRSLQ